MLMGTGLRALTALFRSSATPSQAEQDKQLATGGGSDVARDKLVRDDGRARSMQAVGARVSTKKVLDKAGVIKTKKSKKG